ncbi:MAG: proprotein convertase P-domain-containing protein [Deltaproteobacteria bacterium]|nr:proprotein convertase P-domain-containing protein [Deltaproteobacteria bacterium]
MYLKQEKNLTRTGRTSFIPSFLQKAFLIIFIATFALTFGMVKQGSAALDIGVSIGTTEAVTIAPTDTQTVGNAFPFGMGTIWPNNAGFIYKNIPAFELGIGDTLAFDLGAMNDVDIQLEIALATTTVDGGDIQDATGFTTVVTNTQVPANPRGDTTVGNYELQFTAEAPFSFAGGGLIIRFSNPGGAFASDSVGNFVLVRATSADASGYFVKRFFTDADGVSPWDSSDNSDIGGFRISNAIGDTSNYYSIDSKTGAPVGPAASAYWNDIFTTGTEATTLTGCDDCTQSLPVGFDFPFYGSTYTSITAIDNGVLSFDAGYITFNNTTLPNGAGYDNLIAPFWEDLSMASKGTVHYQTFGTAPDRTFIVQWTDVPLYYDSTASYTFQAQLSESGAITFAYDTMTNGTNATYPWADGSSATIGVSNADATKGFEYSYNTVGAVSNGLAINILNAWDGPNVGLVVAVPSSTYSADILAKVLSTNEFYTAEVFNAGAATPTLAELLAYDSVLTCSDTGYADNVVLGDNLADYVDAGGGVVSAVFANASIPIAGRWATDGYYALEPLGQASGTRLTLDTAFDSLHPLMTDVTTLDGGSSSYISTSTTLGAGAVIVANWSSGAPLVIDKTTLPVVDLNIYPPSSEVSVDFWEADTHGRLLMRNALLWTAGATTQTHETINTASTAVPVNITDNTTITSTINIGNIGDVADVNVNLDITHTYDGDLLITLISPSGTRVVLSNYNGGGTANFTGTIFDDEATTAISSDVGPYAGSYTPDEPLSNLDSQDAAGNWTLEIHDGAGGDIGSLNSWSLAIVTYTVPTLINVTVPATPGVQGIDRADGGSDASNIDATTLNPVVDVDYVHTIRVTDPSGVTPQSVRIFIRTSVDGLYIGHDLTCTGTIETTQICSYTTRYMPTTGGATYYFETVFADGTTETSAVLGPINPVLLNGYNMAGIPREASLSEGWGIDYFGQDFTYRWISGGITTGGVILGAYDQVTALNTLAAVREGEGYFVWNDLFDAVIPTAPAAEITAGTTEIALQHGWNIISNPYDANILLSDVMVVKDVDAPISWTEATASNYISNGIYYFDGSDWGSTYSMESAGAAVEATLTPWMGFWIYVKDDTGTYSLVVPNPAPAL